MLDRYCERVVDGWLGEPLNLASNLAFFVAAALAVRAFRRRGLSPAAAPDVIGLIALMAAIGLGSGFWHLTARVWALWADVIPIVLFINVALVAVVVRGVHRSWWAAALALAVYHAANGAMSANLPPETLNGSVFYLPAWVGLLILCVLTRRNAPALARRLLLAAAVFTLSLAARTVDAALCPALPIGTHWVWHTLNALVLLWLIMGLIDVTEPRAAGLSRHL